MRLPIRRFSALLHTHQLPSLALSLTHAALAVRGNHHPSTDARSRTDSVVTVSTYPVVVSSLPPFPRLLWRPAFLKVHQIALPSSLCPPLPKPVVGG